MGAHKGSKWEQEPRLASTLAYECGTLTAVNQ